MAEIKVYATEWVELNVDAEQYDKIDRLLKASVDTSDNPKRATELLKNMYKRYRLINDLTYVVGFVTLEETKKAYAILFKDIPSDDTLHRLHFDDTEARHYILLNEGVSSPLKDVTGGNLQ